MPGFKCSAAAGFSFSGVKITLDTNFIAVDSVDCTDKDLLRFKLVYRGGGTVADDIIGTEKMYIEIQERKY